ncbi:hypothetical protein cyc_02204 [Cyclospora cayetanensis]|uniref:HEAT repeat-containing protein n=1 Tax=Cyclospora cayetanensis TaxID=88456 RepID=A0A1D3D1Q6_9EIME|nr:hypothetical protein cyc_02204 [Cyclospora cayetanensis]
MSHLHKQPQKVPQRHRHRHEGGIACDLPGSLTPFAEDPQEHDSSKLPRSPRQLPEAEPFFLLPLYEGGPLVDCLAAAASDVLLPLLPRLLQEYQQHQLEPNAAIAACTADEAGASGPAKASPQRLGSEYRQKRGRQQQIVGLLVQIVTRCSELLKPALFLHPLLQQQARAYELREIRGSDSTPDENSASFAAAKGGSSKAERLTSIAAEEAARCLGDPSPREAAALSELQQQRESAADPIVAFLCSFCFSCLPSSTASAAAASGVCCTLIRCCILQEAVQLRSDRSAWLLWEMGQQQEEEPQRMQNDGGVLERFLRLAVVPLLRAARLSHRLLGVELLQQLLHAPLSSSSYPCSANGRGRSSGLERPLLFASEDSGTLLSPLLTDATQSDRHALLLQLLVPFSAALEDSQPLIRARAVEALPNICAVLLRSAAAAPAGGGAAAAERTISGAIDPSGWSVFRLLGWKQIATRCRDNSVLVRRQAMAALHTFTTEALHKLLEEGEQQLMFANNGQDGLQRMQREQRLHEGAGHAWRNFILHAATAADEEPMVREKAFELTEQLLHSDGSTMTSCSKRNGIAAEVLEACIRSVCAPNVAVRRLLQLQGFLDWVNESSTKASAAAADRPVNKMPACGAKRAAEAAEAVIAAWRHVATAVLQQEQQKCAAQHGPDTLQQEQSHRMQQLPLSELLHTKASLLLEAVQQQPNDSLGCSWTAALLQCTREGLQQELKGMIHRAAAAFLHGSAAAAASGEELIVLLPDDEVFCRHLVLAGELALMGLLRLEEDVAKVVQALVLDKLPSAIQKVAESGLTWKQDAPPCTRRDSSGLDTVLTAAAAATPPRRRTPPRFGGLFDRDDTSSKRRRPASSLQQQHRRQLAPLPLRVRVVAVHVLGKLAVSAGCVPSSASAPALSNASKKGLVAGQQQLLQLAVELLAAQLHPDEPHLVRLNAVVVLSDVLQRHGQLADKVLPLIVSAIASDGEASFSPQTSAASALGMPLKPISNTGVVAPLRKMALVCLSRLLTEDFVRCKGEVVLGLFFCLGDEDASVRQLAESVYLGVVLPRHVRQNTHDTALATLWSFILQNGSLLKVLLLPQ